LISTGLQIVIPIKYYGRIAPRSGLALNHFIDIGAGVIDQDYRGEVKVLLFNFGENDFKVRIGINSRSRYFKGE
jgi:dUTP pyrophosphatase